MTSKLQNKSGRTVAKVAPARTRRQPVRKDELQVIPGVGPSISVDLRELGIRKVADLKGKDPERMYRRLIQLRGSHQDRCLLYVFRSAVYFASTPNPRPELLDWWNWKDRR